MRDISSSPLKLVRYETYIQSSFRCYRSSKSPLFLQWFSAFILMLWYILQKWKNILKYTCTFQPVIFLKHLQYNLKQKRNTNILTTLAFGEWEDVAVGTNGK